MTKLCWVEREERRIRLERPMSPKRPMLVIVGKAATSDKWNPIMKEEKGSSHVDKKKHRYVTFVFI